MADSLTYRVIFKDIPGDEKSVLVARFPQVVESVVRPYRVISRSSIASIRDTGEVWTSMGRTFSVVDIKLVDDAVVSLSSVLDDMADEKITPPKTKETIEVSLRSVQINGGQGGIYVMGSCESCWCDNVWC